MLLVGRKAITNKHRLPRNRVVPTVGNTQPHTDDGGFQTAAASPIEGILSVRSTPVSGLQPIQPIGISL